MHWPIAQIGSLTMVDQERPVFRFAPSPNGYLHLGHAYSALLNAKMAREMGGRLLLRIEDIDAARCRPAYERAIYEDLAWLGLHWDEPVRRQSEHLADYAQVLNELRARGLIYPCFCSRGDIIRATGTRPDWPRDPDGSPLYPHTCRLMDDAERAVRLAAGERAAWRLDLHRAVREIGAPVTWTQFEDAHATHMVFGEPEAWGDVVLARRDIGATYHISVVVDDAQQGITDIVRGKDLFASTSVHRLLQALLGLAAPRYRHHDLITDMSGHKLSKSRGSPSLRDLRASGVTPEQIGRAVGL